MSSTLRYGLFSPVVAPGGWNINTGPSQTRKRHPGIDGWGLPHRSLLSILCNSPGGPRTARGPADRDGERVTPDRPRYMDTAAKNL